MSFRVTNTKSTYASKKFNPLDRTDIYIQMINNEEYRNRISDDQVRAWEDEKQSLHKFWSLSLLFECAKLRDIERSESYNEIYTKKKFWDNNRKEIINLMIGNELFLWSNELPSIMIDCVPLTDRILKATKGGDKLFSLYNKYLRTFTDKDFEISFKTKYRILHEMNKSVTREIFIEKYKQLIERIKHYKIIYMKTHETKFIPK